MFKFSFFSILLALATSSCAYITDSYVPYYSDSNLFEGGQALQQTIEEGKKTIAENKKLVDESKQIVAESKKIVEEVLKKAEEVLDSSEETDAVVHEVHLKLMADGSLEHFDIIK